MKFSRWWIGGAILIGSVGFAACGTTAAECVDHFGGGGAAGGPSLEDCLALIDASVDARTDASPDAPRDTALDVPGETSLSTFSLGGTLSGYAGTGLSLENGTEVLSLAKGATSFTFATKFANAAAYDVKVKTQPTDPSQTCTVAAASGSIPNANVTNVSVTCVTNTYPITVAINGLKNAGLVLQNNAADDLTVAANLDGGTSTSATFATKIASGANYAVTIKTQPDDQTCTIAGATGTVVAGPITTVTVTCTNKRYMVGGTVSGLAGTGLVLQNSLGDDATVNANGTYSFATPLETGTTYSVTVKTQPTNAWQTCTVANGTGTINATDVTNANITCVTNTYFVGATVSGLAGSGLVLQNNGADNRAGANGFGNFAAKVASGAAYNVTVLTQPTSPSQTCVVSNGAGTVAGTDIANVTVVCTTNKYTVGGSVSGLAGAGLVLQNNGGDNLAVSANGSIVFPTSIDSGSTYNVSVLTQPTNLSQTCSVTNGAGTVGGSNITNVGITCVTNSFVVNAEVSGLVGSGLVLRNNGGDNRSVSSNGSNAFATSVLSGGAYNVTVLTQPTSPSQTCVVTNGSGTVAASNVSATVTCTTNTYTVGGTVSGLTAGTVVLRNNGGNDLSLSANGSFTFSAAVPSGATYTVTVQTQPLPLVCSVTNGSGTITNAAITNVVIACTPCPPGSQTLSAVGLQDFVVPACVSTLTISATGAKGGGTNGGNGARMIGTFAVTGGETLKTVVGDRGVVNNCGGSNQSGGGGGASVVWRQSSLAAPMIMAGGGGGGNPSWNGGVGCAVGLDAVLTADGLQGNSADSALGGTAGSGGAGNGASGTAAGGAGWLSAGQDSTWGGGVGGKGGQPQPGFAGGVGSTTFGPGGEGGIGGGGGATCGCGGGGGFSGGGGGGGGSCRSGGGGGGSFNGGSSQTNTAGVGTSTGSITFTW